MKSINSEIEDVTNQSIKAIDITVKIVTGLIIVIALVVAYVAATHIN